MKLRQRVLSILLTVAMIIGLAPVLTGQAKAATSGTCGENLTWTLDSKGTLTISGTGEMDDYKNYSSSDNKEPLFHYIERMTDINIKSVIINYGVTSIGNYAFKGCNITNVYIPDSVNYIG